MFVDSVFAEGLELEVAVAWETRLRAKSRVKGFNDPL